MNILIAGSRDFNNYDLVESTLTAWAKNQSITNNDITIISGGARGADKLGERFAKEYDLKLQIYPADWNQYGKSAGYKRNTQMAEVTDVAFIFWDGESKGTKHMIDLCKSRGIDTHVIEYNKAPWEE